MACYKQISRKYKKQKIRKIKLIFLFIFLTILVVGLFVAVSVYKKSMNPTLLKIAEIKVRAQTALIINQAVVESVGNSVDYDSFVSINVKEDNKVSLVSVNSSKVNLMASQTAINVQKKLHEIGQVDVNIPWGTLSGIPLLSNKGSVVTVEVTPIPSATCNFTSQFVSAGINQTLHRIYINVNAVVDLVLPSSHMIIELSTPVLLCETLIVGEVPQMYIDGGFVL